MHQEVERGLEWGGFDLALYLETQRRHGLAEKAAPGAVRRDRLLVEQPLQVLIELIGLLLAQVVDPGLVVRQRLHLQGASELCLIELVELELEEDQVGGDGGDLFLDVAVELGVLGIRHIAGKQQARVGAEPTDGVAQALVGGNRLRQLGAVAAELGELALVALFEVARQICRHVQVRGNGRGGWARIEVIELPGGHRPQIRLQFRRRIMRCRLKAPSAPQLLAHWSLPIPLCSQMPRAQGRNYGRRPTPYKKASMQAQTKPCVYPDAAVFVPAVKACLTVCPILGRLGGAIGS